MVSGHLQILFPANLSEICRRLVEHNDDDAADKIIEYDKVVFCFEMHFNGNLIQNFLVLPRRERVNS